MAVTKIDISNENLDLYFLKQVQQLTNEQRSEIPYDILRKIYKTNTGEFNNISKLAFLEKLYVLSLMNRRWFLLIEKEDGKTVEEFTALQKSYKKKKPDPEALIEVLIENEAFVVSGKEMIETVVPLNSGSRYPLYNYLVKAKNYKFGNDIKDENRAMAYICRFVSNYEQIKKRLTNDHHLSVQEWVVLIYVYAYEEVVSSKIHKEIYRHSYTSSQRTIKQAFGSLKDRGLVQKLGSTRNAKLRITELGYSLVNKIMNKYLLNC